MDSREPGRYVPSLGGGPAPSEALPAAPERRDEPPSILLRRIAEAQSLILEKLDALEASQEMLRHDVDDRLSDLESTLETLSDRLDAFDGDEIKSAIDDLESTVDGLSDAMSDVRGSVDDMESSLSSLETTVSNLESSVDSW